ncbi:MAG: deoxyribodipyrimidine photo-lyase, partial [Bacteroidota bacterium]
MQKVNIVWFKRDIRLLDNEPLYYASLDNVPVILLAFLEPSLMALPQSDSRHWRFVT